ELLKTWRLLESNLLDETSPHLLECRIKAYHGLISALERLDLTLHQRVANAGAIDRRLVRPALRRTRGDQVRAIADRPRPAVGDNRSILKRQDDGRHVVERGKIGGAERKIALGPKRVDLVPAFLEQSGNSNDGIA